MTPPYRITYESVTTDLGTVATKNCARKVDVQLYNAYLIIPGIVLHLSSKNKKLKSTNFAEVWELYKKISVYNDTWRLHNIH